MAKSHIFIKLACLVLGVVLVGAASLAQDHGVKDRQEKRIPGTPFKKTSGALECPLGVLASAELPKQVLREYAHATEFKMVGGEFRAESKWRNETYTASAKKRPIWLVFRAGDTTGKSVSINDEEFTVRIGDSEFMCLGADITEKDSAMAGFNLAYSHKGNRGYRRLLFVIPSTAKAITVRYKPKKGTAKTISVELPAEK